MSDSVRPSAIRRSRVIAFAAWLQQAARGLLTEAPILPSGGTRPTPSASGPVKFYQCINERFHYR